MQQTHQAAIHASTIEINELLALLDYEPMLKAVEHVAARHGKKNQSGRRYRHLARSDTPAPLPPFEIFEW